MITMPAAAHVVDVGAERGRVERDQDVGAIGRRVDVVAREVDLEAGDTRHRAGGGADLRGKIGKRRQVVPGEGGLVGELRPRQLHSVARVTGESDRDVLHSFGRLLTRGFAARHAELSDAAVRIRLAWGGLVSAGMAVGNRPDCCFFTLKWALEGPERGHNRPACGALYPSLPGRERPAPARTWAAHAARNPNASGHFGAALPPDETQDSGCRADAYGMLRRISEPLALSEASLLALRPALNAPVLNVDFLPVGPARARRS